LAWLGLAWLGLAWLGLAWLGLAWLGLAWLGLGDTYREEYKKKWHLYRLKKQLTISTYFIVQGPAETPDDLTTQL
jgi:hypothetical protein